LINVGRDGRSSKHELPARRVGLEAGIDYIKGALGGMVRIGKVEPKRKRPPYTARREAERGESDCNEKKGDRANLESLRPRRETPGGGKERTFR